MLKIKKKIIGIVFFSVLCTTFSLYFYQVLYQPNILVHQKDRFFVIPYHSTFQQLQKKLQKEKIVHHLLSFSLLARWMKLDQKIKPGYYFLKQGMHNLAMVRLLRSGKQHPVNITFHSVRTLPELVKKLTKNIGISSHQLLTLLQDENFLSQYHFDSHTVKAMFIPNTYQVYWTYSAEQIFIKIYTYYQQFWNAERRLQAQSIGLTPIQVSILASIVEEETNQVQEYAMIAGVFINRLKRGIPLQACPTLRYAMQDFTCKRLLYKHQKIPSLYNTYLHKGLPPGPIRMPSVKAIEAVLHFKKHLYLYFSAKEDFSGMHYFSKTLQAHNQKARRYQSILNQKKIFN